MPEKCRVCIKKIEVPMERLVPAVPHRPRWAEKRFGKRVRLYVEKPLPPPPPPPKIVWITVCSSYSGALRSHWIYDCSITRSAKADEVDRRKQEVVEEFKELLLNALGWNDTWETLEISLGLKPIEDCVEVHDDGEEETIGFDKVKRHA